MMSQSALVVVVTSFLPAVAVVVVVSALVVAVVVVAVVAVFDEEDEEGAFSFRAASCNNSISTRVGGICIYRTTLPRMKHDCNDTNCGYFIGSTICTCNNLIFKY
jgi:hypothetical protein